MNLQKTTTVPLHWGLFDPLAGPEKTEKCPNKPIPLQQLLDLTYPIKEANLLDINSNKLPQQVPCNKNPRIDEEFSRFLDKYDENVGNLIDLDGHGDETPKQLCSDVTKLVETDSEENSLSLLDIAIENMSLEEATGNSFVEKPPSILSVCDKDTTKCLTNVARMISIEHDKTLSEKSVPNVEPSRIIPTTEGPTIGQALATQIISKPTLVHQNRPKCLIETINKDEKLYRKCRRVKSERDISQYSKGAGLYEKSVVLPQMLERLTNRRNAVDTKKNLPKKLLLDTGKPATSNQPHIKTKNGGRASMEDYMNNHQIGNLKINLGATAEQRAAKNVSQVAMSPPEMKLGSHSQTSEELYPKFKNTVEIEGEDKFQTVTVTENKSSDEVDNINLVNGIESIISATKGPIHQALATQKVPKQTTVQKKMNNAKCLIETVNKEEKLYKKCRRVKCEKEIAAFSIGASVREKCDVLPQIFERLISRQIARDIRNDLLKKLVPIAELQSHVTSDGEMRSAALQPSGCTIF